MKLFKAFMILMLAGDLLFAADATGEKKQKDGKIMKIEFKDYEFMNNYIDCLGIIKSNFEKYDQMMKNERLKGIKYCLEFKRVIKTSTTELSNAKNMIAKYKPWDNKKFDNVKGSVIEGMTGIIDVLIKLDDSFMKLFSDVTNYERQKSRHEKEIYKIIKDRNAMLKILSKCTELASHVIVKDKIDSNGNYPELSISDDEKKKISDQLIKVFGENVKGDASKEEEKDEPDYLLICGNIIYNVLNHGWVAAEETSNGGK